MSRRAFDQRWTIEDIPRTVGPVVVFREVVIQRCREGMVAAAAARGAGQQTLVLPA